MRRLSASRGALVLLTAVLVNGCSSDTARVPPLKPAALQLDQVHNVAVTIRHANQPADGTSFTILEPIEFALEFDYDTALIWDAAVLLVTHEPDTKHPDGVANSILLGSQEQGTTGLGTTRHWSHAKCAGPGLPAVRFTAKPGNYELRNVLVRHPQTVAEKVDELESPQKFQTVIRTRSVEIRRGVE